MKHHSHTQPMSCVRYRGISLEELYLGADFDSNHSTFGKRVRHRQVTSVNAEVLDTSLSHDRRLFNFSISGEGIPFGKARFCDHRCCR